jgi:hypothetical protein
MSNNHDIIRFRRGTAAEWANSQPQPGGEVLRLGEPGFEKDTYKLKIGDGITSWNDLPYIAGGIGGGDGPLVYVYDTDFSATPSIDNITISTLSNGTDYSLFFQDLVDESLKSSIKITNVNDSTQYIILSADVPTINGLDVTFPTSIKVDGISSTFVTGESYYINIDIIGSSTGPTPSPDANAYLKTCSLELTGGPYYGGDPVTVYQPNSDAENKVFDSIDTDLTLTRGSVGYDGGGGLYNSILQVDYGDNGEDGPTGTLWNADGWNDLSNVADRTYDTLYNILNGNIGTEITNAELVMHDTINDKYYKFDFFYWQPGGGQNVGPEYPIGGFGYTRRLLWIPKLPVTFVRPGNQTDTVDNIDDGLTIKRSSSGGGGIFNSDSETEWDVSISPSGTLWNIEGWDDLTNIAERDYRSFYAATGGQLGNNVTTRQYIMKDTINNKYYKVEFSNWSGGGAFTYTREEINGYCSGTVKFSDGTVQDTAYTESAVITIANDIVTEAFNTSLVSGTGIALTYDSGNDTLTISTSGVSLVGHNHVSTDITDFNSAVSGLLPVKDIVSGSGISVGSTSGVYTISSSLTSVAESNSLVTNVFNKTGSPISKFSVVYINGGQGDQPTIGLAVASGEMTSSKTYGITAENIVDMSAGKVIVFGALTGLNTDQFNPTAPTGDVNGTVLYLSPTTPGGVTTTKPSAPDHMVSVGTIVRTHQNEGVVEVRVQNGFELQELHNVSISGPAQNQTLIYNTGTSLWTNTTLTSSHVTDFTEAAQDVVGANGFIIGQSGIVVSYSDNSNTLTISSSGLAPNIANSGDNRVLTSTGSSSGINAESNLTFDGTTLNVSGRAQFTQVFPTVVSLGNQSANISTDVYLGQVFNVTLTGDVTLDNPTNSVDGVTVRWRIKQDAVGGRTVTLGSDFVIPSSATSPLAFSTAANSIDILGATYYAADNKWHIIAFVPGY